MGKITMQTILLLWIIYLLTREQGRGRNTGLPLVHHDKGVPVNQRHHGHEKGEEECGESTMENLLASAHPTLASLAGARVLT